MSPTSGPSPSPMVLRHRSNRSQVSPARTAVETAPPWLATLATKVEFTIVVVPSSRRPPPLRSALLLSMVLRSIVALPILLVLAIPVVIVLLIIRRARRRKRAKTPDAPSA